MANETSLAIFKRPGLAPWAPRADTNLDLGGTCIGPNRETLLLGSPWFSWPADRQHSAAALGRLPHDPAMAWFSPLGSTVCGLAA
jgi:hypothetical protein